MRLLIPSRSNVVLVTGGGGFVGVNIVRELVVLGYDVHLLLKSSTNTWRLRDIYDKVTIHNADILKKTSIVKIVKKVRPSVIFHFASHGAYPNQQDFDKIVKINTEGTFNLLWASKDLDYELFVNIGSSAEYGVKNKPMSETNILMPLSFYAASKASSTLISQVFARQYKKPVVIIRLFSVYGPFEEPTRFIPRVITRAMTNSDILVTDNFFRHDFIFIKDVVSACLTLLAKKNKFYGEIFNIGTGIQYTNQEIAKMILRLTNSESYIKQGAYRERSWDSTYWVADITKTKKLLGFKARYTIEKGLIEFINWMRKNLNKYKVYENNPLN